MIRSTEKVEFIGSSWGYGRGRIHRVPADSISAKTALSEGLDSTTISKGSEMLQHTHTDHTCFL